jgi:hypothetical protein
VICEKSRVTRPKIVSSLSLPSNYGRRPDTYCTGDTKGIRCAGHMFADAERYVAPTLNHGTQLLDVKTSSIASFSTNPSLLPSLSDIPPAPVDRSTELVALGGYNTSSYNQKRGQQTLPKPEAPKHPSCRFTFRSGPAPALAPHRLPLISAAVWKSRWNQRPADSSSCPTLTMCQITLQAPRLQRDFALQRHDRRRISSEHLQSSPGTRQAQC